MTGRQVLEVGSGVNPLCCLAALKHCRRYVATDGSLEALQGLARNLDLNCRYFPPDEGWQMPGMHPSIDEFGGVPADC